MWSQPVPHVHEFSYLRGLDGRLPRESDTVAKETKADSERRQSAAGPSQVDYLRRLADGIRTLQVDLQRKREGGRITAIGVVGSDVYDKLLVLRALRAGFPDVIFFTTDADALYVEPSESRWTQNLLVVSSFGLAASRDLQGRIPPFRDSYQTATFLTVLRALHVTDVGDRRFKLVPTTIEPRVFELGRLGAIDLSPQEPMGNAPLQREQPVVPWDRWNSHQGAVFFCVAFVVGLILARISLDLRLRRGWPWLYFGEDVHGSFARFCFGAAWAVSLAGIFAGIRRLSLPVTTDSGVVDGVSPPLLVAAGIAAGAAALCVLYHAAAAEDAPRRKPWPRVLFAGMLVAGVAAPLIALRIQFSPRNEEPFAWFQGVSIWPTEILRAAAMLMSVGFVVSALRRLRETNERTLAKLPRPAGWHGGPIGLDERIGWSHLAWRELFLRTGSAGVSSGLAELAFRFAGASLCRRRFVRVILYLGVHLLVFGALMALLDAPSVPARGTWSLALDTGFLVGSVGTYLILLVLVFDAIVICRRFVQVLVRTYHLPTQAPGIDHRDAFEIVRIQAETNARLVYLPFSVLFLLIVSRASLFDRWSWPVPLIIVLGAGLALIAVATIMLNTVTREAKATILEKIRGELDVAEESRVTTPGHPEPASHAKERLEKVRDLIEGCTSYVFQGLHQMPLIRAVLFTLGGVGSLQVLDKLVPLLQ